MNKILLFITLLLSLVFSSTGLTEWQKIVTSNEGTSWYTDLKKIMKEDNYIYIWKLRNSLIPDKYGDLSSLALMKIDCNSYKFKIMADGYYKEKMGMGTPSVYYNTPDAEWSNLSPKSVGYAFNEHLCKFSRNF